MCTVFALGLLVVLSAAAHAQFTINSVNYPATFASNITASFEDVLKLYFSDEQVQDGILVVEFLDFDIPNNSSECKSSAGRFVFFDMLERSVPADTCLEAHKEAHFCNSKKPKKNTVIVDLSAQPPLVERGSHRLNIGVCRGTAAQPPETTAQKKSRNGNGKPNGKNKNGSAKSAAKTKTGITGRGFNATITLYKKKRDDINVDSLEGTVIQPVKFYSKL